MARYIECYANAVNALYHLPSLGGVSFDFTIIRIELMQSQDTSRVPATADRNRLYESFCDFQAEENAVDDADPMHWDISLLLTGEDLYDPEELDYDRYYKTMGISYVGGICDLWYSCVLMEFGATDSRHRTYPSTGFGSVIVTAHEMAHNLGEGKRHNYVP